MRPLSIIDLPVNLKNQASTPLNCRAVGVFASYRIFDERGAPIDDPPSLRTMVETVPGDGAQPITMRLQAPANPGNYEARLSMVQEGVSWWADLGYPGTLIRIVVEK